MIDGNQSYANGWAVTPSGPVPVTFKNGKLWKNAYALIDQSLSTGFSVEGTLFYGNIVTNNKSPNTVTALAALNQFVTIPNREDRNSPVIDVASVQKSYNTAARTLTLKWITNEASDTRVLFGTTPALGGQLTDPVMTTSHTITLTQLLPNTLYYLWILSKDAGGNYGYYVLTFTT